MSEEMSNSRFGQVIGGAIAIMTTGFLGLHFGLGLGYNNGNQQDTQPDAYPANICGNSGPGWIYFPDVDGSLVGGHRVRNVESCSGEYYAYVFLTSSTPVVLSGEYMFCKTKNCKGN